MAGQLMVEVFTVDAGDQADVSVLPDLCQDLEIAFSALQIAVLSPEYNNTLVPATYWLDKYFTIKQRGNTPNRDSGRIKGRRKSQ